MVMTKAKKPKYYTVRAWKKTWVFDTRAECEASVKWFQWAQYKSFPSCEQAEHAFSQDYEIFLSKKPTTDIFADIVPFEKNSIAVDAACSGNPWIMEYRGVDLKTWEEIFREKFKLGTNNIGEFLALIHGIAYLDKKWSDAAIYSDSRIAINRVKQKKCTTKLERNSKTEDLYKAIVKALLYLEKNQNILLKIKILKRDTKNRWEIPADFGRK